MEEVFVAGTLSLVQFWSVCFAASVVACLF